MGTEKAQISTRRFSSTRTNWHLGHLRFFRSLFGLRFYQCAIKSLIKRAGVGLNKHEWRGIGKDRNPVRCAQICACLHDVVRTGRAGDGELKLIVGQGEQSERRWNGWQIS